VSKTTDLKARTTAILKTVNTSVYDELAPDGREFPYIVFSLESVMAGSRENYSLEINCYDYGTDPARVDGLADSIESLLKDYSYISEQMQFRTFLNTRNSIQEEDKKIRRKRLLFDLYYFERRY
jgi:hypothetical protein